MMLFIGNLVWMRVWDWEIGVFSVFLDLMCFVIVLIVKFVMVFILGWGRG